MMAGMTVSVWTKTELEEQITLWKTALKQCSMGKSYTIGSRQLTRQDISDIIDMLDYLTGELAAVETGTRGPVLVQGRRIRGWRVGR